MHINMTCTCTCLEGDSVGRHAVDVTHVVEQLHHGIGAALAPRRLEGRVEDEARTGRRAQPAALDDEALEDVEGHTAHPAAVAGEHGVGRRACVGHAALLHAVQQRGGARAVAERRARRDGDAVVVLERRELRGLVKVRVRGEW